MNDTKTKNETQTGESEKDKRLARIFNMIGIANKLFDNKAKEDFAEVLESQGIEVRICSKCGNIMYKGYIISDGSDYYCGDDCLYSKMTKEEYLELYDDGNGDSFWTTWYENW